ncbi:MAG: hypothetical protein WHT07_03965 [Desulfobaccales bacterium]
MKIDDLVQLVTSLPAQPSSRRPEEDFAPYLGAAVQSRAPAAETPGPVPISGPAAVTPLDPDSPLPALEAGLRRLEAFARGLADPGTTLRDLEPLAQELWQDSHRLTLLARSVPPTSPLRAVTEETAALAYVESLKFQRGDYL